ncbi:MAG: hypothetical protein COW16_08945 [Sphingomonadales bacterium CG12_big_fil_rev_8_21_14_0_65_65_10]|nr:MAG: hypothetical protein COW16_08945 [Sphingomonadales bacterium CG12_big_fil_rev_8_21_14_0_65_65_10]
MKLTSTLSLATLAIAGTLSSFAATTAPANAVNNHYYRAQLASPVETARSEIQKGVLWDCEGDTCVAPNKGRSRDVIVCQRLASEFGEVTAFRAANNVFDADELAKCND